MVLTFTHNLCFEQKLKKYNNFSSENDTFHSREKSQCIAQACLRHVILTLQHTLPMETLKTGFEYGLSDLEECGNIVTKMNRNTSPHLHTTITIQFLHHVKPAENEG